MNYFIITVYQNGVIIITKQIKTHNTTLFKFYMVVALPPFLYYCEMWTLAKNGNQHIQPAEMEFSSTVTDFTCFAYL